MRIAVVGATGTVGRHVAAAASDRGHEVVAISRRDGVDVLGPDLAAALAGVNVVIDTSNVMTQSRRKSIDFFTGIARRLSDESERHGVARIVALSIVGLERAASYGYYQGKLAQEQTLRSGSVPVAILRSTQFHEFPEQVMSMTTMGPLAAVPVMRTQPIATEAVATSLLECAEDQQVRDRAIAGPQPESLTDLARDVVTKRGGARVVPLTLPWGHWRAWRNGAMLPDPGTDLLGPTFTDWLASRPAR